MEPSETGRGRFASTSDYHRRPSNTLPSIEPPVSASTAAARFDDADRRPRDRDRDRDTADNSNNFRDGYTMATPTAGPAANAAYRPHPSISTASSYSSAYPSAGLASAVEARRTSDESEPLSAHRRSQQSDMSLPSLHEALGSSSESRDPHRSLPPPLSFTSRPPPQEPLSSFSTTPSRSTLSARANVPPPLPMFDRHQPPPPTTQSYAGGRDREADYNRQPTDSAPSQLSGGYAHHAPQHTHSSQHPPPLYSQPAQRPPGQLPLPSLPSGSPRQTHSTAPSPLDVGRPPPYHPDEQFARNKHEGALGRPFDTFPYLDALNKIALSSRIIFNFAEAFDHAAKEANGAVPQRLPNESEISVMMENTTNIQHCLSEMQSMIQHNRMQNERARDMAREVAPRRPLEEEDVHMYSDASKAPQQQLHPQHPHHPLHHPPAYSLAEVKKRRGVSLEPPAPSAAPRVTDPPRKRAAPPGRCHSCNRVDTPEWRRGPDGARTLCNACGLHYAKLERKRQTEQRSIRPKPVHDH